MKGAGMIGIGATAGDESPPELTYDHRLAKRALHYLWPSAWLVLLATALLLLYTLVSLAGPLITRYGIDRYIATGDQSGLRTICLLWVGILVVGAGLQYAQMIVMNLIGQRAMLRLRAEIYAHLQRLPISFFNRNPIGRLMTRATNDVEVLNQMFSQGVVAIFGDIFAVTGIMVVLLSMNVKLSLITFAFLPVLVVVSMQFRRRVRRAFRSIRLAVAKINSYLQEMLGGLALVKAMRREHQNEREFSALNREYRNAFFESVRAFALYFPLVELIQSLAIALILWYGGGQVWRDELTFGALVAFIQYVGRFFRPIRDLSDKYNILQDAMASSERIFSLLDEPAEEPLEAPPVVFDPRASIRFENVSFSYDGQTPVLRDLSVEFPAGKTSAIVGATGGGKTTLVDLMSRFYEPTAGRITIGGTDLSTIPRRSLRRAMARVEQEVYLFSGTVEENIRLWSEETTPAALERAIATSHADHLIGRLPRGRRSAVAERGASFSTGERQLIAFARALVFDPDILILDEATASIDSETESLIQDALAAMLRDRTAIVIAHRLSTIRNADQILVIHQGRLCERGTHAQLLAAGGMYSNLYELQFRNGRT